MINSDTQGTARSYEKYLDSRPRTLHSKWRRIVVYLQIFCLTQSDVKVNSRCTGQGNAKAKL